MKNFWNKLPKPFFVLAPMEDVTDTVFRRMVIKFGRPDVCFTEFTNVDGIVAICGSGFGKNLFGSTPRTVPSKFFPENPAPKENGLLQRLVFTDVERPIVAQIWGNDPQKFYEAAKHVASLGFDGIDINLACPARPVLKIGCGGALIGKNSQVREIVDAVKEGAENLPVSVKTRIGVKRVMTEEWIGFLLELGLQAITIHGRTVAEKSKVPASWEEIGKAVKLKTTHETAVIGNGDVKSLIEAKEKAEKYGVDGVMIGRGIFENVAVFNKLGRMLTPQEKVAALIKHLELFDKTWAGKKNFQIMKKFVKAYINGFDGASGLRGKLMEAENSGQLKEMLSTVGNLGDDLTDKGNEIETA